MNYRTCHRREALTALAGGLALLAGCEMRTRDPGIAIIGSSPTGVPFSFIDPWTNEFTGSMIDTVRAVADQASLPIDLRVTPFSALIPSLLVRKIDVIAAAMLRTSERERVVAFSDPVYAYSGGLVVRQNDLRMYANLEALRSLRVGAQVGTRFIDQLQAAGIERILTYDSLADMLRDLSHGRVDAAYGDAPILKYQLRVGPQRAVRLVTEFVAPSQEELCFVLRHGDPLIPRINSAIQTLLRHGRIDAIVKHWGLV